MSTLSIQSLNDKQFGEISQMEQQINSSLESLDTTNMGDMLMFQQQMSKITMQYSLSSSVTGSIAKATRDTIQKIQ